MSPASPPEAGSPGSPAGGPGQGAKGAGTFRQLGGLLSIGWTFALSIGIGLLLGMGFDRWLGTRPWGMIAFLLLGITSGFVSLFRIVSRLDSGDGHTGDDGGTEGG